MGGVGPIQDDPDSAEGIQEDIAEGYRVYKEDWKRLIGCGTSGLGCEDTLGTDTYC
jgi:hypothetical protein